MEKRDLPSSLLKHATSAIGDFFVHAALLFGIDLALAEFLLYGIEACWVGLGGVFLMVGGWRGGRRMGCDGGGA